MRGADVPRVCAIHTRVLPTTTASLGNFFLIHFYKTLLQFPDIHKTYVAEQNNTIIGSITATKDMIYTQHILSKTLPKLPALYSLLTALFSRQVTVTEVFKRIVTERQTLSYSPRILTLCVDKTFQNTGIGKKLMTKIIEDMPHLYVDTEQTNTSAQSFYTHLGFVEIDKIGSALMYKNG